MIFHGFCIRKSSQNTSQKPPKIIKKIDQKFHSFFYPIFIDLGLQKWSKMLPETFLKQLQKLTQNSIETIIEFGGLFINLANIGTGSALIFLLGLARIC